MKIHFDRDIKVLDLTEEKIFLSHKDTYFEWEQLRPIASEIIQMLLSKKYSEEELICRWMKKKGELPDLFYLLEQLHQKALLSFSLGEEPSFLFTLRFHLKSSFRLPNKSKLLEQIENIPSFQLSRFAFIRNRNGKLVCETPLAPMYLELEHPDATAFFLALAQPISIEGLEKKFPHISPLALKSTLALLLWAHFLETEDPSLITWDFHDLLFHTRSRRGRHGDITATRYRFLGKIPPLPPLKPMPATTCWIELLQPNLEEIKKADPLLTDAIEARESIREHGDLPITLDLLAQFLYRSARVKQRKPAHHYEATKRPYPGGGACYELEIYPLVHRCQGLEKGLYYYHPEKHALTLLEPFSEPLEELLNAASSSMGKNELPQILLLIACRFQRLNWKYQSMAYATILKDAGVLMQTMYLVATAMGLAPCAIGSGNSDLFAKLAKTNYYEETTVGEFILGSRKK